jgi:hypothetical protein
MNNTQIAKVIYAAQSALDETNGSEPLGKWEELTDQERSDVTSDVSSHLSGADKGVDPEIVAKSLTAKEKLKYYVSSGIVDAFSRYERGLERQTTTSTSEPTTVKEAMAKADQSIAQANQPAPPKPPGTV